MTAQSDAILNRRSSPTKKPQRHQKTNQKEEEKEEEEEEEEEEEGEEPLQLEEHKNVAHEKITDDFYGLVFILWASFIHSSIHSFIHPLC